MFRHLNLHQIILSINTQATSFMVAPCINNIKHVIAQLMHTNYKILRLLK